MKKLPNTDQKIRICSDLHLEFATYSLPHLPDDKTTILVLAGDIGVVNCKSLHKRYLPFLEEMSNRFKAVILVAGNHEHYHGSIDTTHSILKVALNSAGLHNVIPLENMSVVLNGISFIGSTMWTNCDNNSPFSHMMFNSMSDSEVIRVGNYADDIPFTAQRSFEEHTRAINYIFPEIVRHKEAGNKVVVVTHHLPTRKSLSASGRPLDMFYASELYDSIIDTNPDVWVHGHTHTPFDYIIEPFDENSTRIICNPRGYHGYEDIPGFDPVLTITL